MGRAKKSLRPAEKGSRVQTGGEQRSLQVHESHIIVPCSIPTTLISLHVRRGNGLSEQGTGRRPSLKRVSAVGPGEAAAA